ncbi:MAG: sulfatase-like hydrolase/transferase [Peptostreptococcaceae bacterium]|nr:sulfatase-like hydrolase/transferase [Peptostreptococcaceae bacterium]
MEKIKRIYLKHLHNSIGMCAFLALTLNFIIEALSRQSILEGLSFFVKSPLVFLFNSSIIFAFLSFSILFRRRFFAYVFLSLFWLALGIINGIILKNRMTPFTTKDLEVLGDGLSLVTNYLSKTQIILSLVGLGILLAGVIALVIFAPKRRQSINYKKNILVIAAILVAIFGITNLAIQTKVVDTYFGNLNYAYRDYGVPYCFLSTWLNTGVKMPKDYSRASIEKIIGDEKEPSVKSKTNIIMLQLESFEDPNLFNNIILSEDPVPNFRELKQNYSTGVLTVPVVGAGTANTEFESITGMSVKFFGPGEYPYKSILTKETCESIPFDLKEIGYSTHAIHNHRAVFYGRNKVFKNLGFDTFTSLEYMIGPVKTPKNWAKDGLLTDEIMAALKSTPNQDYIYTISVQGHGKYPTYQVIMNPAITVSGVENEALKWQYEYYVNQIREMDLFIKDLTETLAKYDEKVVLVMYGDHLPALEMKASDMKSGSLYQTEYVIWSNFGMQKKDENLTSYQLGAEVLDRIGIHEGTLTRFHQTNKDPLTYKNELQTLEYDMLYGSKFVYSGVSPFMPTNMKMGVRPITISKVVEIMGKFYLKGENFTEYSKVSLGKDVLKTIYLSPTVLGLLEEVNPADVSKMKVSQVEKNKEEILSTTE